MKSWIVILLCLLSLKAIQANATVPPPPPPPSTRVQQTGPCMIQVTDATVINANALLFMVGGPGSVTYVFTDRTDVRAQTTGPGHTKIEIQRVLREIDKCKGKE